MNPEIERRRRPRPPDDSRLAPPDYDRALWRMKAELALTDLRRRLFDPSLDAREVLGLARRILALQAQLRA